MLAIPPFGASSNIALWRANIKPPVELVVDDLECLSRGISHRKDKADRVLWQAPASTQKSCENPFDNTMQ